MTTTPATQELLPVTPEARKAAADLLDEVSSLLGDDGIGQVADLIRDGEYDEHDATIAFAKFEREILARDLHGVRENDKPPAHWVPDDKCDRHPQSAEEWDWRADKPENAPTDRSIKRLNFAIDRGDPTAPNQMALVLRVDLSRALGRLTHYTAHRELLMKQKAAALTPSALSGNWISSRIPDGAIEAGIEAWRAADVAMETRDHSANPEDMADWDEGMIVAAIFKAVSRAMPGASALSGDAGEGE